MESDEETQTVTLTFPPNTITRKTKKARLDIEFNGIISDKLRGLYRSTYSTVPKSASASEEKDEEEEEGGRSNKKKERDSNQDKTPGDADPNHGYKYYATTQFEAIDARRAFPCFDEPALKATFSVSLIADERLIALSNGRELRSEIIPGAKSEDADDDYENEAPSSGETTDLRPKVVKKRTIFEKTPKMSTYLLAFIVGSFDSISDRTKSGTLVRVFTPRGRSSEGSFALDIAVRSLDYFEEYFGIKFPMAKCDQVSINDFSAGMWRQLLIFHSDTYSLEYESNLCACS